MKFRIILKASLMLGLVIAGRFARNIEQANPGCSLSEILLTTAPPPPVVARAVPVPVKAPLVLPRPIPKIQAASAAQAASFADLR